MFNTPEFAYEIPWFSLVGIPIMLALVMTYGVGKVVQSNNIPSATGKEGMIGEIGEVRRELNPTGQIFIYGELWGATSQTGETIEVGAEVTVVKVRGLRLTVERT